MATFIVNNINDSGEGSLREAINNANNTSGEDVISFGAIFYDDTPDTIVLTSGQLTLTDAAKTTINGSGVQKLSISGNNATRVFQINDGAAAVIKDLAIANGATSSFGAGIYNQGTLELSNLSLEGNSTIAEGGGIYNTKTLLIGDSTFRSNEAGIAGGGISNFGFLSINNSVFDSNQITSFGTGRGGGICNVGGILSISNTTFAENNAEEGGKGGAIYNEDSVLSLTSSTLHKNSALLGGGIYNSNGVFTISNSTLSSNTSSFGSAIYTNSSSDIKNTIVNSTLSGGLSGFGAGLVNSLGVTAVQNSTITDYQNTAISIAFNSPSPTPNATPQFSRIEVSNSIIAGNGKASTLIPDVIVGEDNASFVSLGNNLIGIVNVNGNLSGFIAEQGDILVANDDLGLAPLADNGGLTKTHALLPNSLAINAGSNALVPRDTFTDQRGSGFVRSAFGTADIGAFELQVPIVSISPAVISQAEGNNSGLTRYLYTVSLSHSIPFTVEVDLNLTGGTATFASGDIAINQGGTFFAPGETSKQVYVDVKADNLIESDETFVYSIIGATNATIAPNANSVTGIILNDDANLAPIAVNDAATVAAYQSININVLANDSDRNGDVLSFGIVTDPDKGTAIVNDNGTPDNPNDDFITYTPVPGFCGEDSLTYLLKDGQGGSAIATVSITVTGANLVGTAESDVLKGTACADTIDGKAGSDRITGNQDDDQLKGGGGQDRFIYNLGDGTDTITDFGGVGRQGRPPVSSLVDVDTIQFQGIGLTASNLLLTQVGTNLELTFESQPSTKIILQNFQLENLENTTAQNNTLVGNILFNGQTRVRDGFDVFTASSTRTTLFKRNTVTFLNDLNNIVSGFDDSNDVINGQGGDDRLTGKRGNDILRGGAANDALLGGAGNDRLCGNTGADQFVFGSGTTFDRGSFGVDTIADFTLLENDKIVLSKRSFRALTSNVGGSLASNDFASINASTNNSATTLTARIIYNQQTGDLIYNQNGAASGFGSGGRFATLPTLAILNTASFLIQR
ncbi:MAG TPA: choice-of-anchor Q domain-containing protein [Chroococcidiopsis sp.]